MLCSRYKANSRYVSIEAYPFALPCGERIKANRSMRAREQAVLVLCLVLPMEAPQAPVLRARERRANVGIA